MEEITLTKLFESQRERIRQELNDLGGDRNPFTVSSVISKCVEELCEADGQYRKSLTKMEEHVFQSAISLMNSQQTLITKLCSLNEKSTNSHRVTKEECHSTSDNTKLVGSALVGGAVGAIFSSWAAVLGSAGAVALMLYSDCKDEGKNEHSTACESTSESFNSDIFLDTIASICQSMDNLLMVTRNQIELVKKSYEQMEKPTLQNTYPYLLTNIKDLITISESNDDDKDEQILLQIELIKRSLKNYDVVL